MNTGRFKIEMGAFEYGALSSDPINEAYETANMFYEPNTEMKVWVYLNVWGDETFVELPYAGPIN